MKAASDQSPSGATTLGAARAAGRQPSPGALPPASPPATRAARRTWNEPRLLVGVAIVASCVLLGARLLASADDTVAVWSVRDDLPAGSALTTGDLQRADLRFGSSVQAGRYVSAQDPVPAGMVLTRDVDAGELLPRAALEAAGVEDLVEVPLAVPSEAVPATLHAGEVVDVWVTPAADADEVPRAVRVLEDVRVVALPHDAGALGPSTTRQVVVGLSVDTQGRLTAALGQLSRGTAVLVRRG